MLPNKLRGTSKKRGGGQGVEGGGEGRKGARVMFSCKLSENNMPKLHHDELWFCKGRPSESLC